MPEAGQARLQVYVLKIEKNGNKPTEYEDATSVRWGGSEIRLALADGASAAIYAGAWARMLVRRFVRQYLQLLEHLASCCPVTGLLVAVARWTWPRPQG